MAKKVLSPIDSFIQYFLTVKPYHTKLLEIIQQYNFSEAVNVVASEVLAQAIEFNNPPLCSPAGFGVDFDDGCGFDSDECCDLFQCIGGYGIIYDNSDLLVSTSIVNIDTLNNVISVQGDYTSDQYINILSIPDDHTITFQGDVQAEFAVNNLFLIVPRQSYSIVNTTVSSFSIQGNQASNIVRAGSIEVFNAGENSGEYDVASAVYSPLTNLTVVEIASVDVGSVWKTNTGWQQWTGSVWNIITPVITDVIPIAPSLNSLWFSPSSTGLNQWNGVEWVSVEYTLQPVKQLTANLVLGYVNVNYLTTNSSPYTVDTISFNGNTTSITINETFNFTDVTQSSYGAVRLRKGLTTNRIIDLNESCACWVYSSSMGANTPNFEDNSCVNGFKDIEYKVLYSTYDRVNNVTNIQIAGALSGCVNDGNLYLYGYIFGSGFDENEECANPKSSNIAVQMSEQLLIQVYQNFVTPTVTPTITFTPTLTPVPQPTPTSSLTMSPTPSITASITPTLTSTLTATPTITITSTITPTVTVTPSITGTAGVSATATPTATPTPTAGTTLTPTSSITPTVTMTQSITMSPTLTPSVTVTPSLTPSISVTISVTRTPGSSATPTPSATPTVTSSITFTPSATVTITPTVTRTATVTPSITFTPTVTATQTVTVTPAITPTPSVTPSTSLTPSISPSAAATVTPSPTSSATPSITASLTPSSTATPTVTATTTVTVTPTVTPTFTVTRTITPTSSVTVTPSVTASITPTPSPSATRTPSPSLSGTVTPSATPSVTPSVSVTPSLTAAATPSPVPTSSLTPSVTAAVTPSNTAAVTPSTTAAVTPSQTPTRTPAPPPSVTPSTTQTGPVFIQSNGSSIENGLQYMGFEYDGDTSGGGPWGAIQLGGTSIADMQGGDFQRQYSTWLSSGVPSTYDIMITFVSGINFDTSHGSNVSGTWYNMTTIMYWWIVSTAPSTSVFTVSIRNHSTLAVLGSATLRLIRNT